MPVLVVVLIQPRAELPPPVQAVVAENVVELQFLFLVPILGALGAFAEQVGVSIEVMSGQRTPSKRPWHDEEDLEHALIQSDAG